MRLAVSSFIIFFALSALAEKPVVVVGSKVFTEGYILSEIIAQTLEQEGEVKVVRKFGLGGTGILYDALQKGSIDLYPEYTGTISEAILKNSNLKTLDEIQKALVALNLVTTESLGFDDTYALTISKKLSEEKGLLTISDLSKYPGIRIGLSHEFINRPDGWIGLSQKYSIKTKNIKALEHSLAYEAISRGEIELTDAYSTDAKIQKFNLVILKDDKQFFPQYEAVVLARKAFADRFPRSWKALKKLENSITTEKMQILNAQSEVEKKSFERISREFLRGDSSGAADETTSQKIWLYTKQHLTLVGISLLTSIILGLPLGVLAARYRTLGQIILIVSGLLQTIPSLALLCFFIPIFGIGMLPALVALFLYGLLPIVMNTSISLISIEGRLIESAKALGLSSFQRLVKIELPLASPGIMAGIKTSAIINIGTATLAALIGAGGYGTPIVTGLALNDVHTILEGAIPAAAMALVVYAIFELINRVVIPKGLR